MDDIGYVKSKKNLYNTNTELGLKKKREQARGSMLWQQR